MNDCVFCKIISEEFDSAKIWENDKYLAILIQDPNTLGVTLVMPKKHYDSYAFDMPDNELKEFIIATKKTVKILEKGLNVKRVAMVMEGMGVNHAHMKLYPLHGLDEKFKVMFSDKKVFFDKYEGYITTVEGPIISIEERKKIAQEILKKWKYK